VLRSPEFLAEKRKLQGPYTFGAQMLLNPKADTAQGFRDEWLKYWGATNFTGSTRTSWSIRPTPKGKKNDYTSMWVIGAGGDNNYYVMDACAIGST
jgi:hypothetical protein